MDGRQIEILHPVSILIYMCRHRHVILHLPDKFRSNGMIGGRVMT